MNVNSTVNAINSKLTREFGISYDVGNNFKQEMDRAESRIDQKKWCLFARKSDKAVDWLIDKIVAAGGFGLPTKGIGVLAQPLVLIAIIIILP